MDKITVSIAQMQVVSGKPEENLRKAEAFAESARKRQSHIVCFPEMWTTGLDWERAARTAPDKAIIQRIASIAKRHSIWICGSMPAPDRSGRPANTLVLFDPGGAAAATYRKTHLFAGMREDLHMTPGESLTVADTPWGKVGFAICYDLRFPEIFRSYALKGAKMIMLPAAFPEERGEHWKVLIRARAIEDQLFMVAANQVGAEGLGASGTVRFFGRSAVIGPSGETLVEGSPDKEELLTAPIDLGRIAEVRRRMDCLHDRRPDLYNLN
jgi:predicted amidohydrolase